MRSKLYGGVAVLLAVFATAAPGYGQAGLNTPTSFGDTFGGASSEGLLDAGGIPGLDQNRNVFTAPLGDPGKPGIFTFADAVFLYNQRTLGDQQVAVRGLLDSTGRVTGLPGTLIGSGVEALNTRSLGRTSMAPGINIGIGYKLDDGTTITARIKHLAQQTYNAGASLATPFARSRPDLTDTFLVAPVFNFPNNYAGQRVKTGLEGSPVALGFTVGNLAFGTTPTFNVNGFTFTDTNLPDGLFYGIWNGASLMTIAYSTNYTEAEIGGRVPLFESAQSKIYGLSGVRYHNFQDRFYWRTTSYDINGNAGPQDSAVYTNVLSQRMYGPYVGCGHEVYLGQRFSLSGEMSGGAFLNIVKERAKYKLEDDSIQNKRAVNSMEFVPTVGGNINMWWYPVKGVQVRVGYEANTFYNTRRMARPIAFDYGAIDPGYGTQYFRIIHGLNVGVGIFF